MILTLLERNNLYTLRLPEKVTGKYILKHINASGNDEPVLSAEGIGGKWQIDTSVYAKFLTDGKETREWVAESGSINVRFPRTNEIALLMIEEDETAYGSFVKKRVIGKSRISVGCGKDDTICYNRERFPDLAKNHFILKYDEGKITLSECSAKVYVDHKSGECGQIAVGTQLFAAGVKVIVGKDFVCFNYEKDIVSVDDRSLTDFVVHERKFRADHTIAEERNDNLFYCSPRFCTPCRNEVFEIDNPPSQSNQENSSVLLTVGPSLTMGMASIATAGFTVINNIRNGNDFMMIMPTVIMAGGMFVGSIIWPVVTNIASKHKVKKNRRKTAAVYAQYIKSLKDEIYDCVERQKQEAEEFNPSVDELLRRVECRDRKLWERMNGQDDFLNFSAGIGSIAADINIKFKEKNYTLEKDPLYDIAANLAKEKLILENVPVTVSLTKDYTIGITGDRQKVLAYARGIMMQIVSLHSYEDVRIIVIADEKEYDEWKFARWLPHVCSEENDVRFIACGTDDIKDISPEIEKNLAGDSNTAYIVFSCDKKLASKSNFIKKILDAKEYKGFSLINLYDEIKYLPKECTKIIDLSEESAVVHDTYGDSVKLFSYETVDREKCTKAAVTLANIHLAKSDKLFMLPESYTFMELMDSAKCEHLNCEHRWRENNPVYSLRAPVGIDENGDICYLDLHQDCHGPHGLVAGMTGSGKSEFIMTYILSMALNYHPHEVSFILIDYKGGGMSKAFKNLPHLAGMITNLDGAGISRALVSIESELKRREQAFAEAGERLEISNLDIYKYQKLYRSGAVEKPIPHLFIISDEFAELKSQQPEFMDKLISTARIGRSLGVHLILATQKPNGVVSDQIWSNSRFKVCLKVQDTSDSMDMIKCPDAAALSTTGRYYLQVGYNELFIMGQTAWTGAVYHPEEKVRVSDDNIIVIGRTGRKITQASAINFRHTGGAYLENRKQLDAVLEYIETVAESEKVRSPKMWLPPLPEELYLSDITGAEKKTDGYCYADVGLYDAPKRQEQGVVSISPLKDGNVVVYGSANTGKTSFLNALILSMAEKYSPDEVNFYLIDFGSETLTQFRNLAHVGEVIVPSESDRLVNLFRFIKSEAEKRKELFMDYGGDYISYCERKEKLPEMIIIINNYSGFSESVKGIFDISLLQLGKLGISFVVTASIVNAVGYSAIQNFRRKICMQLNDDGYYSIFGKISCSMPMGCKGRGIIQLENEHYEFQTAMISEEGKYAESVNALIDRINEGCSGKTAVRVPRLPETLTKEQLVCKNGSYTIDKVPVALEAVSTDICTFNFSRKFNVISHKSAFGSTVMQGITELLSELYDDRLIIVDRVSAVSGTGGKYKYMNNIQEISDYVKKEFFEEALERHNYYNDCVRSGQEAPVYEEKMFIFCGLSALLGSIEQEARDSIIAVLEKVGVEHGYRYVFFERISELNVLNTIRSFSERANQNEYIWVGDGYSEQFALPVFKSDTAIANVPNGGYVAVGKRLHGVMLVGAEEWI